MLYLLESPVGVALFEGSDGPTLISKMIYKSTDSSLKAIKSGSSVSADVAEFLSSNLPEACELNVLSPELASTISACYRVRARCVPDEIFRMLRVNPFKWFGLNKDVYNAVALRVTRQLVAAKQDDVRLIETLSTIEELEQGINNRIMRIREWYALHFPELSAVSDNLLYLKYVLIIGNRSAFLAGNVEAAQERLGGEAVPADIVTAARNSMGVDLTEYDTNKIRKNAENIVCDMERRQQLIGYLGEKGRIAFPNMFALIGEMQAARLMRKAGSISALAQMASSTVQILGAEKAFNEAVCTKGNTPKFGIIHGCKAVSKAGPENSGRIARFLANKISLCTRVDLAGELPDGSFGEKCREAVEALCEKLSVTAKAEKRPVKQQKKRVISVKEYDQSRDSSKKFKNDK